MQPKLFSTHIQKVTVKADNNVVKTIILDDNVPS